MISTTEIADDLFRISVFVPEINLEFSHFLIRDDEPMLFHAGLRGMFPILREQVSRLIDLSKLRHIGFSHFTADSRVSHICPQNPYSESATHIQSSTH